MKSNGWKGQLLRWGFHGFSDLISRTQTTCQAGLLAVLDKLAPYGKGKVELALGVTYSTTLTLMGDGDRESFRSPEGFASPDPHPTTAQHCSHCSVHKNQLQVPIKVSLVPEPAVRLVFPVDMPHAQKHDIE